MNKYILWIRKLSKYLSHQCWYVQTNPPWKAIVDWGQFNCNIYSIQLSLLSNFSQDIVLWWEQALQKSSESESSVMVLGKCEWTTYMPYGGGRNNTDALKLLHKDFSKNMWIIISFFFPRRDRDFYNLIVRDEIEICTF